MLTPTTLAAATTEASRSALINGVPAAPGFPLAVGVLVLVCAVLFAVAFRRAWALPVWGAVLIALGVRLAVAGLSYGHTPDDAATYFQQAGQLVLDGQNPATTLPRFQWNFLPLMPYVYALQIRTGLPWEFAGKIAPIVADVVIVALLARLAPDRHARSIPLLYALCPVAILVSAEHGQVEPVALALGLGALLLARSGGTARSGVLAGLAVATKTWPVLLAVGVVRQTPWRRWWRAAVPAVAVLLLLLVSVRLFLHDSLWAMVHVLASYRSLVGRWGWTGILHFFDIAGSGYQGPRVDAFQRIGTIVMAIAIITALVLFWRTGAVALTMAVLLTFLVVTAGFGAQYLLWPVPFVLLLRRPAGLLFTLLASAYAAMVYLITIPYPTPVGLTDALQQWGSLPVIAAALVALPWAERRTAQEPHEAPGGRSAVEVPRARDAQPGTTATEEPATTEAPVT